MICIFCGKKAIGIGDHGGEACREHGGKTRVRRWLQRQERTALSVVADVALIVLYVAWIVSLFGCMPLAKPRTPEEQARAAVALVSPCGSTASGVVVAPREILTAAHFVISCPAAIYAADVGGKRRVVVATMIDPDLDVARLRLADAGGDFPDAPPIIARAPGGAVCFEAGQPARRRACGTVTAREPGKGGIKYAARTVPGNSGSGLYDTDGRLIGIVVVCVAGPDGACAPLGGGASALK